MHLIVVAIEPARERNIRASIVIGGPESGRAVKIDAACVRFGIFVESYGKSTVHVLVKNLPDVDVCRNVVGGG
jgi:hypothetical protein